MMEGKTIRERHEFFMRWAKTYNPCSLGQLWARSICCQSPREFIDDSPRADWIYWILCTLDMPPPILETVATRVVRSLDAFGTPDPINTDVSEIVSRRNRKALECVAQGTRVDVELDKRIILLALGVAYASRTLYDQLDPWESSIRHRHLGDVIRSTLTHDSGFYMSIVEGKWRKIVESGLCIPPVYTITERMNNVGRGDE